MKNNHSIHSRKIVKLILLCLTFSLLFNITFLSSSLSNNLIDKKLHPSSQARTIHKPILIDGNLALSEFCAGNGTDGTETNPHIIENYHINLNSSAGIEIRNMNARLLILNCKLDNGEFIDTIGIKIINCTNLTIMDCIIKNVDWSISIESSSNISIRNNECTINEVGITINNSEHVNVYGNNCSYNRIGIDLYKSINNSVMENLCIKSSHTGIWVALSTNNWIAGNNCSYNLHNGFVMRGSDDNWFTQNNVSYNQYCGMEICVSDHNYIYNNIFSNNSVLQVDVCDNSWNYWWSDKVGNYWSDYTTLYPDAKVRSNGLIWDTPYEVEGVYDYYPLVNSYYLSENENDSSKISAFPLPILVLTCLSIWFVKKNNITKSIRFSFQTSKNNLH